MEKKKRFRVLLRDPDSNIHIFIVTKNTSSDDVRTCVGGGGSHLHRPCTDGQAGDRFSEMPLAWRS